MKVFYKHHEFVFLFLALGSSLNVGGHSVQVAYCVSCTGELTLSIDSVKVVVIAIPVSNVGTDISTCSSNNPGTVGATTTVGYTYSWSTATNLSNTIISNPNITLTNPGTSTYTVTSTAQGCIFTGSVIVKVNLFPVADFDFTDVCLTQTMNFNELSTISIDNIVSWSWSFGDNNPAFAAANPLYTYISPGTYNVSLKEYLLKNIK